MIQEKKQQFINILESQPKESWTADMLNGHFGRKCSVVWVLGRMYGILENCGRLIKDYGFTRNDLEHMYNLNDSSSSMEEAHAKIIEYVESLV